MSGSVTADRQLSEQEENHDLQVEEMLCLSNVLSDTDFEQISSCSGQLTVHPVCETSTGLYTLSVDQVKLFRGFCDERKDSAEPLNINSVRQEYFDYLAERFPDTRHDILNLPPIELKFWFPSDYPSRNPPNFQVSCSWMSKEMKVEVMSHLVSLWRRNGGLAVLYDAFEHLKALLQNSNLFPLGNLLVAVEQTEGEQHFRHLRGNVIQVASCKTFVETLKSYDAERTDAVFHSEYHQCPICCSNRPGSDYIRLCKCRHWCCRHCLKEGVLVHICGGSIQSIRCLDCSDEILPQDVQTLVSSEDFDKYQRLQLNNALDCMGDIVFCPRPGCNAPVIKEPDSEVAQCTCGYVFCLRCKASWHGVAPCQWNQTKIAELEGRLGQTDKEYVKEKLLQMITDARSEMWIENNAKHCPRCGAKVEKSGGCNHMSCQVCQCHFCWLCMAVVDKADPYRHYNDPRSPCNQLLFQRPEEDDDVVEFVLEEGEDFNQAVEAVANQLEQWPERWFDDGNMDLQARMILEGRVRPEN